MKKIAIAIICICLYGCKNDLHEQKLIVASYNLRMDTPEDSANAWKYRKDDVKILFTHHHFDIIGTQEGFVHQLKDICLLAEYAYIGVGRDDGKSAGEHSAIIYNTERLEALASGNFWLSATPEVPSKGWDANCCNRICSWANFRDRTADKKFFVFNVHFDHEGVEARKKSAELMVAKITDIAGDLPVICTGDFNSTDDTQQIETMLAALYDSRAKSIEKPYGPEGTFNTRFANPIKKRIDYIFVNNHINVLKYAVLTDNNGLFYPSDHLPVSVTLLIE
jgi:endonuclease/exonuclease/phosphatase family metal-dependent hydrolase